MINNSHRKTYAQATLEHIDGIMTWINDPEVTFYFRNLGRKISK